MKDVRELLPMHVLWRGVIEILCGYNKGRKKYSMQRARNTYDEGRCKNELTYASTKPTSRHLGEIFSQALKIDKSCQEGGDLHARCLDKAGDKLLKWHEMGSV